MLTLPRVLEGIPDLEQFYEACDEQFSRLSDDVESLEDDLFFEDMGESRVTRWEKMLALTPSEDETLEERRFRVQTKVLDKLPYTYRVILSELRALAGDAELTIIDTENGPEVSVSVSLSNQSMLSAIANVLDIKMPLNMAYKLEVMYNTHGELVTYTHDQLHVFTHEGIKTSETI